ncbi:hypothetical protein GCM10019996_09270 [Lentilactobacillus parakefiri]|nr:hypothetical protein FD08_GL003295 [Lentilactobacillus parakefiri DSM 10551]
MEVNGSLIALLPDSSYNYLDVSMDDFKSLAFYFGGFGNELSGIVSGLAAAEI